MSEETGWYIVCWLWSPVSNIAFGNYIMVIPSAVPWVSSVSVMTRLRAGCQRNGVSFQKGPSVSYPLHCLYWLSGQQSLLCIGYWEPFVRCKTAVAWSWPLTSRQMSRLYLHSILPFVTSRLSTYGDIVTWNVLTRRAHFPILLQWKTMSPKF